MYFRFSVSYRDVEELKAERGVTVTHETIRAWCENFGKDYAKRNCARRDKLGDTRHLEDVFVKIGGRLQFLWRADDQEGNVLDILVGTLPSQVLDSTSDHPYITVGLLLHCLLGAPDRH